MTRRGPVRFWLVSQAGYDRYVLEHDHGARVDAEVQAGELRSRLSHDRC